MTLHLAPILLKSKTLKKFPLYYEKKTSSGEKIGEKLLLSSNISTWYSYKHLEHFDVTYIWIKIFGAIWDTLIYTGYITKHLKSVLNCLILLRLVPHTLLRSDICIDQNFYSAKLSRDIYNFIFKKYWLKYM